PLRTFPLPTLVPHNPLSLFHILYVWLRQVAKPEASNFDPLYEGWFSPETRSVHVTDTRSIRGLWEQGFYGKGSLSRSEPSWMTREKSRRGNKEKATAEENRAKRRLERQEVKWERARKEREAIDQRLSEEAEVESSLGLENSASAEPSTTEVIETSPPVVDGLEKSVGVNSSDAEILQESSTVGINDSAEAYLSKSIKYICSPVGPLELLSLPNSSRDVTSDLKAANGVLTEPHTSRSDSISGTSAPLYFPRAYSSPVGPLELLALPNSTASLPSENDILEINGHAEAPVLQRMDSKSEAPIHPTINDNASTLKSFPINGHPSVDESIISDLDTSDQQTNESSHSEETVHANGAANGSAVANGHPPSPIIKRQKSVRFSPTVEKNTFIQSEPPSPERGQVATTLEEELLIIKNQEHTQLTLEEAFFLSYALGALTILDPTTNHPIPSASLLTLFRKTSYFPPTANPILAPDDPFMVNYVVYHHFRSLGWVPRSGIKFSCDLLLYVRGPVFDHAEFGIIILPSYSDPYWSSNPFLQNYVKGKEKRTWHWMNCINRVITQVKKTLILCYVDIPRPLGAEEEAALGVDGVLGRYKVKEIVMKRFSANRMRD
ncbi:putative tRNA-splicing endonuclease subunit, partial [Lachnellula suecica]